MVALESNDDGTFGCLDMQESELYRSVAMTNGDFADTIRGLLEKLSGARSTLWIDVACRPNDRDQTVVGLRTKFLGGELLGDKRGVWKRLQREFVVAVRLLEDAGARPDIKPDYEYTLELFFEEGARRGDGV